MPSDRRLRSPRRDLCSGASPASSPLPVVRPVPPAGPRPRRALPFARQVTLRLPALAQAALFAFPPPPFASRPSHPLGLLAPSSSRARPLPLRPSRVQPPPPPRLRPCRALPFARQATPRPAAPPRPCPDSSVCAPFPRASEAPPSVDEALSLLRSVARGDGCRANRSLSGRGSGCRATIACAILPLILTLVVRPRQCCSWTGGHPSGDREAASSQVVSRIPRAYAAADDATGGPAPFSARLSPPREAPSGAPRQAGPACRGRPACFT